jgi:Domain of unknown function (DUF4281)
LPGGQVGDPVRHCPECRDVREVTVQRRDEADKVVVCGVSRIVKLGVAEIGLLRRKDQTEQRGATLREIQIAKARRHRPVARIGQTGLARLHRVDEAAEPFGCECGQKALDIAEVMRRSGVADPGALGDRAQGKGLHTPLGQFSLGRSQKRLAQVTVMIGFSGHSSGVAPNLVSVKIFLDAGCGHHHLVSVKMEVHMSPDQLFQIANPLALLGWLGLAASPLAPRPAQVFAFAVPLLLSILYTGLILANWAGAEGGFSSLPEVQLLFTSAPVALAGWVHYLAFDLFVGAWAVRTARAEGIAHWMVLPCLALTFLFGPAGLVAFAALRFTLTRKVLP